MATEIERKFLVRDESWRELAHASRCIIQGYLANTDRGSIRVRINGDKASLNIKSMTLGIHRSEFDYSIPVDDAEVLLQDMCMKPLIRKVRHLVDFEGHTWEVDEFEGENAGLLVAELELSRDNEEFARPPWLGDEVSHDPRYYNVCLVENPYRNWPAETLSNF
jgi:adenylate cyclase